MSFSSTKYINLSEFTPKSLQGGVTVVQIREKNTDTAEVKYTYSNHSSDVATHNPSSSFKSHLILRPSANDITYRYSSTTASMLPLPSKLMGCILVKQTCPCQSRANYSQKAAL